VEKKREKKEGEGLSFRAIFHLLLRYDQTGNNYDSCLDACSGKIIALGERSRRKV